MFDVKKYLIKVEGNRQYLPVSARLVWFRQEHPDWGIETKPVKIDMEKQFAVFEATVFNTDGKLMAKGTKMETAQGFPAFVEAAETGAIGRALAVCGYGTQFAPDLDEVTSGRLVDSPQAVPDGHDSNGHDSSDQSRYRSRQLAGQNGNTANNADHKSLVSEGQEGRDNDANSAPQSTATLNQQQGAEAATEHECAACGRGLTKGQEALSVRKYGIALCPDCQKERKSADAGL